MGNFNHPPSGSGGQKQYAGTPPQKGPASAGANISTPAPPSSSILRPGSAERMIVKGDGDEIVRVAEELAAVLVKHKITDSQLRNIYGMAQQLNLKWRADKNRGDDSVRRQAPLLKARLAFLVGRDMKVSEKAPALRALYSILSESLAFVSPYAQDGQGGTGIEYGKRYGHFMQLLEAMVGFFVYQNAEKQTSERRGDNS